MKNLYLQGERKRAVIVQQEAGSGDFIVDVCSVTTSTTNSALLTSEGYVALVMNDLHEDRIVWDVFLTNFCTEAAGEWFSLTYLEAVGQVVCLNHNGAIVIVDVETGQAELVGEFENGINAAAWSLDREVLLLVTAAEDGNVPSRQTTVLLTMSTQFDVLAEETIETLAKDSMSNADHKIAVCWTRSYFAVSGVDDSDNIRKIRIYHGDTLELAAMGRTEDGSGTLVPNLLPSPIAWAGTSCSHLLAAIQRKGRKAKQVAFFEPNGLRHRELVLRNAGDDTTTVVGLDWNLESDLLAVTLQTELEWKVQLWHRSNYHWYLKREWCFADSSLSVVKFHEEDPYVLLVAIRKNDSFQRHRQLCWIEYSIRWDSSTVNNYSLESTDAFSIDGSMLHVTDFDNSFVPPPMYARTFSLDAPVCDIALVRDPECAVYGIVYLSNATIVVLGRDANGKLDGKPKATSTATTFSLSPDPSSLVQLDPRSLRSFVITFARDGNIRFIAVATSWNNPGHDYLAELAVTLSDITEDVCRVDVISTRLLEDHCLTLTPWADSTEGALLQLHNGCLLEYVSIPEEGKGNLIPSQAESLPEPCPWLIALKNADSFSHRQRLVVGMSMLRRLYLHDVLLADSVSSMCLSLENQYLCYASAGSRCVLRFLSLADLWKFDPFMGPDENQNVLEGYEPRNVERGARIVAMLSRHPTTVLQMPRGNLEIVHPRALVLRQVMIGSERGLYKQTFEMMRKHKVDLNLMVDINPWHFLEEGLVDFVEQIESIDHLNLFISCLRNWNSTEERYPIPHWFVRSGNRDGNERKFDFSTKANQVCGRLRAVMIQAEQDLKIGERSVSEGHFLLPILSTFAKEVPAQLGDALQMIQENALKRHDPSKSNKPALFTESVQSAIHYLAFLADYELLFETALGLYDYDLARAVARNSQMDPKSYLPLINRYKSFPMYYGRFVVDMRLKRFDCALRNLSRSGALGEVVVVSDPSKDGDDLSGSLPLGGNDFDTCHRLIEEHQLYRLGLELFNEKEQRARIMISLGDYLIASKKPETALSIFLLLNPIDYERCEQAAKEAKDWVALFSLMSQSLESPQDERQHTLAREIAGKLASSAEGHSDRRRRLVDGARVLLDYAQDVAGAVDMLIEAENWSEAKRVSCLHSRHDLANRVVECAVDYGYTLIEDFAERGQSFRDTSIRYADVLQIRKEAISIKGVLGETSDQDDHCSLFSAASNASNISTSSTSSTGSAGSLSSVISVKSTTSFTVAGFDDNTRHNSRFHKLGREKRKKKKKKERKSNKYRPGSEGELQDLVQMLRGNCADEAYCETIADTVIFLAQNSKLNVARAVFDKYEVLRGTIEQAQQDRKDEQRKRDNELHAEAQTVGLGITAKNTHSVEAEVDALKCLSLPPTLTQLFSFLPSE